MALARERTYKSNSFSGGRLDNRYGSQKNGLQKKSKRKIFSTKERYAHYKAIAKGEGDVKQDSKFSEEEQRAYARGQVAAREESYRIYKKYKKGNE